MIFSFKVYSKHYTETFDVIGDAQVTEQGNIFVGQHILIGHLQALCWTHGRTQQRRKHSTCL